MLEQNVVSGLLTNPSNFENKEMANVSIEVEK